MPLHRQESPLRRENDGLQLRNNRVRRPRGEAIGTEEAQNECCCAAADSGWYSEAVGKIQGEEGEVSKTAEDSARTVIV